MLHSTTGRIHVKITKTQIMLTAKVFTAKIKFWKTTPIERLLDSDIKINLQKTCVLGTYKVVSAR